jgi:hypothetical protein
MTFAWAGSAFGPFGAVAGGVFGGLLANEVGAAAEDSAVDDSEAMKLAHLICDEWLFDFVDLVPRRLYEVVRLLEKLLDHPTHSNRGTGRNPVLDTVRKYIYGDTPMRTALSRSLAVFRRHPTANQRVLVLVSDGVSTDGDPLPLALELHQEKITMATVYVTSRSTAPRRRLYYQAAEGWNKGRCTLFGMATKVYCARHPVPVLASMGWEVPSSGECGLYVTVSSAAALEEFCSLLLSARFGSADALLDIVGRIRLDAYINDKHVRSRQNPSDQGQSMTCYAHAIAAVVHMALLRFMIAREAVRALKRPVQGS